VILPFFNNFYSLLANVKTDVFSFMTLGSTVMNICFASIRFRLGMNHFTLLLVWMCWRWWMSLVWWVCA